ncbi:MAG: 4'-phosphopantetheinyl transferase superfamily protein [bacterium]|nr:4'-phosphopantetheinyl transferase superfamily protein [bacterium]
MLVPDLDGLLPAEIRTAIAPIGDEVAELLAGERELIERSVASRRREFAVGRVLARQLLEKFGHSSFPILREEGERLPAWPSGIIGSISHSGDLCMAAVGEASRFQGVGVDLEPDEPVQQEIERAVLKDHEHDWVSDAGADERGRRCRMVFSAKEAVYKAFYPTTRTFWSFQDVLMSIDLEGRRDTGTFVARLPDGAGRDSIEGRLVQRGGWIIAAVAIFR